MSASPAHLEPRTDVDAGRAAFRAFLDAISETAWVYDTVTLRFLEVNSHAERVYGYSRDEFLRMTLHDIRPPDEQRRLETYLREHAAELKVWSNTGLWLHVTRTGQRRHVEVLGSPFPSMGPTARLVIVREASHAHTVEVERTRALERYRLLFEASRDAIFIADEQGRYVDANSAACEMFGVTREQLLSMKVAELCVPADHAPAREQFEDYRAKGEMRGEFTFIRGSERRVGEFSAVRLDDGTHLSIVRDVTAVRAAEQRLRESEERLELAVLGADIGLWDWNVPQNTVVYNRRSAAIIGLTPEQLGPDESAWASRVHPEDLPKARATLDRHLLGDDSPFEVEYRIRHEDGSWRWILDRGRVVERDAAGRAIRAAGTNLDITRRKIAELALAAREKFIESVTTAVPSIVYVFDLKRRCNVWCNRHAGEILGYTPEEVRALGDELLSRMIVPEDIPGVLAYFDRVAGARDGEVLTHRYRVTHRDGTVRWVSGREVVLDRDPDGSVRHVVGVAVDVSADEATREALRRSEAKWRTLVDQVPDHVILVGVNDPYPVEFMNRGEKDFGSVSAVGTPVVEVVGPQDRPQFLSKLHAALGTGEPQVHEIHSAPPGLEPRWWESRMAPIVDGVGGKSGLVVVTRDVTHRKTLELQLREWTTRYEAAVQAAGAVLFEWDLFTWNVLFGLGIDELLGGKPQRTYTPESWASHIHPEDREVCNSAFETALRDRSGYSVQYRLHRLDGSIIHVHDAARIVEMESSGVVKLIGFLTDITRQVRHEQELAHTNRELARSNADLERFALATSHDLAEPLRAIAGHAAILDRRLRGNLDRESAEALAYIRSGADRMQTLIDDLLAYARAGSRPLTLARVDLNLALKRGVAAISRLVHASSAQIIVEPLPSVQGDLTLLSQVFQNLVGNAIKFRHRDRVPKVVISAHRAGESWEIRVEDNGIGIEPAHARRLFEMFQRLHTRDEIPGSGVGLALTKRVIERLGGRVWVESVPGEGSSFRFTIPAIEGALP